MSAKGRKWIFFEIATLPMIFVKFDLILILSIFFFNFEKTAENFVIWPKTGHFGHFYQERYLFVDFLLI
jgi:hypothetical protein